MWGRGGSKLGVADKSTFAIGDGHVSTRPRGEDPEPAATTATLLSAHIAISTNLSRKLDPSSS